MAQRGTTDHSFIVGIDKPAGMTSHDVINRVRNIYGERRVGHTGTLDPAATGVLQVCVGPATRLDRFLVGHDKVYEFSCVFGSQTTTDDAEGSVIETMPVPRDVLDEAAARKALHIMEGPALQLPPAYSAIKVDGKKAYEAARSGQALELKERAVTIYSLELLDIDATDESRPIWNLRAQVSAGTYIRSIARDLGHLLNTCAHVGSLRRTHLGNLSLELCTTLERLEEKPFDYFLDPVFLLGCRVVFLNNEQAQRVQTGAPLKTDNLSLYAYDALDSIDKQLSSCTSSIVASSHPLTPGETVAMIEENRLCALYRYDSDSKLLKSACGFAKGVKRGSDI